MKYVIFLISVICAIVFFVQKKKFWAFGCIGLCIILVAITVVNVCTSIKSIALSDEMLDNISKINWDSETELSDLGFEKCGKYYTYLKESPSIRVEKSGTIPEDVVRYKDIAYCAEESSVGILEIKRLFSDKIPVIRRVSIFVDGKVISIIEHNDEGEKYAFEEVMANIEKTGDGSVS